MRYLDDLVVGERIITPGAEFTEEDIVEFAARFDPQPMHTDRDAAALGPMRGLTASGWHTIAVVMSLIVKGKPLDDGPVLGLGVDEVRWPNPVRPGDSIVAELEIVSVTPSRSQPSYGVARMSVTAKNQKGDVVLTMFPKLWVPRTPRTSS